MALRLRPAPYRSTEAHAELVRLPPAGAPEPVRASHYAQRLRGQAELMAALTRSGLRFL